MVYEGGPKPTRSPEASKRLKRFLEERKSTENLPGVPKRPLCSKSSWTRRLTRLGMPKISRGQINFQTSQNPLELNPKESNRLTRLDAPKQSQQGSARIYTVHVLQHSGSPRVIDMRGHARACQNPHLPHKLKDV